MCLLFKSMGFYLSNICQVSLTIVWSCLLMVSRFRRSFCCTWHTASPSSCNKILFRWETEAHLKQKTLNISSKLMMARSIESNDLKCQDKVLPLRNGLKVQYPKLWMDNIGLLHMKHPTKSNGSRRVVVFNLAPTIGAVLAKI